MPGSGDIVNGLTRGLEGSSSTSDGVNGIGPSASSC